MDLRNRVLALFMFACLASGASAQSGATNFSRFNFNVGGGLGFGRGAVGSFVGNSYFGVAGAGWNFNRLLGVDAEYMYYDLGIRPSVRSGQNLGDTSGSLNVVSLNAIIRPPWHLGRWGFYGIAGAGYYRRDVTSNRGLLQTGATCQPSWIYWWDIYCVNNQIPGDRQQQLASFTKDAAGFNYGAGITRRLGHFHNAKAYAEFRYHRGYQSDRESIMMPITMGVRW